MGLRPPSSSKDFAASRELEGPVDGYTMSRYYSKEGRALFGMEQARGAGNGTSSEERCCKLGGEQLAAA